MSNPQTYRGDVGGWRCACCEKPVPAGGHDCPHLRAAKAHQKAPINHSFASHLSKPKSHLSAAQKRKAREETEIAGLREHQMKLRAAAYERLFNTTPPDAA